MNRNLSDSLKLATAWLKDADAVLIGAGAGLSAAAGFNFADRVAFAKNYPGMLQYGFRCKLDMMARIDLPQDLLWGYYLPHVKEVRFQTAPAGVYGQLLALVSRVGDYFVKTTNADGLFERTGFERQRIFTPQGDYARFQCLVPCTQETWETASLFARHIPLIDPKTQWLPLGQSPACPRCGGPTFLNVRGGDWFVDAPYVDGARRYKEWLARVANKKLVILDVGSGFNTPGWIRWPAEQLVRSNPAARLLRINLDHPEVPADVAGRAASFQHSADQVVASLLAARA